MSTLAATTGGSRTWGPFQMSWTPDTTSAKLTITVTAGGSTLDTQTFTPDSATQQISGSNGTFSFSGTVIAGFDASGMSGTLIGQQLKFNSPTFGEQTYSGTIGTW